MGNDNLLILPTASRAATTTSSDLDNPYYSGAHVYLTITASGAAGGGVVLTVEGKNDYAEDYYTIATSASQALNGTLVVKVYPGLTAGTNVVSDHLPRTWRVKATHTDTITYSVSASYLD